MADGMRVQFRTLAVWVVGITIAILALIATPLLALSRPSANITSDVAIARSAIGPVLLWCCCWPMAFQRPDPSREGRWIHSFLWLSGCVLLWLHVAVAFHLGHQWSHEAAWQHTQQTGGFGTGIYVNYTVMVVWLVDAVWLCVAFKSYCARPRWLHGSIHGFIAFIVVNAAVVFGSTQSRLLFAIAFLVPACFVLKLWLRSRGVRR